MRTGNSDPQFVTNQAFLVPPPHYGTRHLFHTARRVQLLIYFLVDSSRNWEHAPLVQVMYAIALVQSKEPRNLAGGFEIFLGFFEDNH